MIKKILTLAIVAGLGYIGYLVWANLSDHEKGIVSHQAEHVVDKAKKLANKAADGLTGAAKAGISKLEDEAANETEDEKD
jgi:hypothetical protein